MTGLYRDCAVRLLCNGDPMRPDYLIEMLIYDDDDGEVAIRHQSLSAISGKTHREISGWQKRHWCNASMTFSEVQELLGELRRSAQS
jgi:hypothetical protein